MTIKDIAQLSGYGIGTVSRVINNHPDVSDKARQRIMEVIEETNFKPNSNAKHLKMRASSSIAIIVKGNQNNFFLNCKSFFTFIAKIFLGDFIHQKEIL